MTGPLIIGTIKKIELTAPGAAVVYLVEEDGRLISRRAHVIVNGNAAGIGLTVLYTGEPIEVAQPQTAVERVEAVMEADFGDVFRQIKAEAAERGRRK
jgi:hypothetical protein